MTVDWLARCVTPFFIDLDGGKSIKEKYFSFLGITFEIKFCDLRRKSLLRYKRERKGVKHKRLPLFTYVNLEREKLSEKRCV